MAILRDETWRRHANPISGWTRMATYPFIFLAIWYHSLPALAVIIVWIIINPRVFPEPKSTESWMSRGVLGERLWTKQFRLDVSQALNVATALFFLPGLAAAYLNLFWPTLYAASIAFLLKVWFVDRMVTYYDNHRDEAEQAGS